MKSTWSQERDIADPLVADATGRDRANEALSRAAWQPVVFAEAPARLDLLRLLSSWPLKPLRVGIHRNQPFEFVAGPLAVFLRYAGFEASTWFGPYDDSLTFATAADSRDVDILWIDYGRYDEGLRRDGVDAWLGGRIDALRERSTAPILVVDSPGRNPEDIDLNERLRERLRGMPGVVVAAISDLAHGLGDAFVDERARTITGSALSDRAAIEVARHLAFVWLPPLIRPRLKAIAVDFDETIYAGVLGEDGADGVRSVRGAPAHPAGTHRPSRGGLVPRGDLEE